jgi:regulator of protease activity HflC (stomatin/prohibitin superfamily)
MPISIPFLIVCVLLILFFVSSIRILKENQRAAIMRLGKFVGVCGPGIIFLIPVVDKIKVVDLNKWIPQWQGLSETELVESVKAAALSHDAS